MLKNSSNLKSKFWDVFFSIQKRSFSVFERIGEIFGNVEDIVLGIIFAFFGSLALALFIVNIIHGYVSLTELVFFFAYMFFKTNFMGFYGFRDKIAIVLENTIGVSILFAIVLYVFSIEHLTLLVAFFIMQMVKYFYRSNLYNILRSMMRYVVVLISAFVIAYAINPTIIGGLVQKAESLISYHPKNG